ncbi:helix-turn-helix domain-containing protein [Arthrobacter sp. BPSS-3]|uniref:helix-turn-helix domain-containing protein n=1 Tax=Arthrobacter sp. BPSS-3 TaxID=3366580 RepID=UPI0037DDA2EE
MRRAIIKPPSVKLLGLVMATYANSDGTRIRPGQRRLANVMGTSISTVERGQRVLESLGFVEMTYKGHSAGRGRPGGYASEYRLTIPSDLLDRIPMLEPDESHPAEMKGDSDNHPAPTTCESEKTPVNGAESPVNPSQSPSTHDGPPEHSHHNKEHQSKESVAKMPTSPMARRNFAMTADSFSPEPSIQEQRERQSRLLLQRQAEYEKSQRETA